MNKAQDVFYLSPEVAIPDSYVSKESRLPAEPISSGAPKGSTAPNGRGQRTAVEGPRPAASFVVGSAEQPAVTPGISDELSQHLSQLAALIANISEAYTVSIFLADSAQRTLHLGGFHTLSRDFIADAHIAFGCGLIGWTAENAVRISVCPFEHDARTLLCYSKDQDLKSFIAVPILGKSNELLGVISCDSKKNYAFAKLTEKILVDCALQAATLITLSRKATPASEELDKPQRNVLEQVFDRLNAYEDEGSLLHAVAEIPSEVVKRDAFVVVTTADWGVGPGKFYSSVSENRIGHRLLDMVCRHKKIISPDRSVHALPVDDIKQRSFLSIPVHVLGREAGSLNLLSRPREAFTASQIAALEAIAKVVGRQLERLRLREKYAATPEGQGLLSWKHFSVHAKNLFTDAEAQKVPLTLLRLSFSNLVSIEEYIGTEGAASLMTQIIRLAEQTVRPPAIGCSLFGTQLLVLSECAEAERITLRLRRLLERINIGDYAKDLRNSAVKLGSMLNQGLEVVSVRYPADGRNLGELTARSRAVLGSETNKQAVGVAANAGNW